MCGTLKLLADLDLLLVRKGNIKATTIRRGRRDTIQGSLLLLKVLLALEDSFLVLEKNFELLLLRV